MAIRRLDPSQELMQFNDRLSRLFGMTRGSEFGDDDLMGGAWAPPCDIVEDKDSIVVRAEVPGMKEEDLDIRIENNILTIGGKREFEKESKERNYHRVERAYGSFSRSFTLPNSVDTENVSADYHDGVLEVRMPKREETKPRQVRVGIGGKKPIEAESRGETTPRQRATTTRETGREERQERR